MCKRKLNGMTSQAPRFIRAQMSTKFQLLMKTKVQYRQIKQFFALSLSDVVFIMLINVKMPKIVTF